MLTRADPRARALRPVRLIRGKDELRAYSAVTFVDAWNGCDLWIRRLSACGMTIDESDTMIDVLDGNGDIIQEVPVTRRGFEYLRGKLRFRLEREQYSPVTRICGGEADDLRDAE